MKGRRSSVKKLIAALLTAALLMGLVGCSNATDKESGKENGETSGSVSQSTQEEKPDGVVDVVWWTNFGKANVEYLQRTIDAFNASQSDYRVSIVYQGNASELNAKIQSTARRNCRPCSICSSASWCGGLKRNTAFRSRSLSTKIRKAGPNWRILMSPCVLRTVMERGG